MDEILCGGSFSLGHHEKKVIQCTEVPQIVHEELEGPFVSLDEAEDVRLKLQPTCYHEGSPQCYEEYHQDYPVSR